MSIKLFPIQILLLFQIFPSLYSLSCKLSEKSSTPYYVGINFPTTARKGFSFTYFAENSKKLNPVEETIDSDGSLFQSTLEQLNDKSYQYIAWNDDPPAGDSGPASRAHAKAVIGVDPDSKTGFYFGHSFPNFPEVKNGKISAAIPNSANIYGQTFFCISLKTTEIEKMMETLAISRPNVYFSNIKEKDFPNLGALADHPNLPKGSDNFAIASVNIAGSNDKLKLYSKTNKDISIFEDVLIPNLKCNLLSRTWGRPIEFSTCDKFKSKNIVQMLFNSNIFWNLKQDHSKWTICDKKKVVCIGDLNRMTSQRNRGGNFFCWENDDMWTGFYKLISQIGVCGES